MWRDWHKFTLELALLGSFSADPTEQKMARIFVTDALAKAGTASMFLRIPATCRAALESLAPSPEHMFWFEYNFLYVLAGGGRADKAALGDHTPAGYHQRARFYAISPDARLNYAKAVAGYIVFLAENTGLLTRLAAATHASASGSYATLDAMLDGI